jgi:hypothetical protein
MGAIATASSYTVTFTQDWGVYRSRTGPERWRWWAVRAGETVMGSALSQAVALVRAKRAAGVEL